MATTTILAVFDSELDLDQALSELYAHGWHEGDVDIIRASDLGGGEFTGVRGRVSDDTATTGTATGPGVLIPSTPQGQFGDALYDRGVPQQDVPFYSFALQHGGTLLMIKVRDEQRASEAREILRRMKARTP